MLLGAGVMTRCMVLCINRQCVEECRSSILTVSTLQTLVCKAGPGEQSNSLVLLTWTCSQQIQSPPAAHVIQLLS